MERVQGRYLRVIGKTKGRAIAIPEGIDHFDQVLKTVSSLRPGPHADRRAVAEVPCLHGGRTSRLHDHALGNITYRCYPSVDGDGFGRSAASLLVSTQPERFHKTKASRLDLLVAIPSVRSEIIGRSGRSCSRKRAHDNREDTCLRACFFSLRASYGRVGALVARPSSPAPPELCCCLRLGYRFDFGLMPIWCAVLHTVCAHRPLERTPPSDGWSLYGFSVVSLRCRYGDCRQRVFSRGCWAGGGLACRRLEYRVLLRLDPDPA